MKEKILWVVSQAPKRGNRSGLNGRAVLVMASSVTEAKRIAGNLNESTGGYDGMYAQPAADGVTIWL